MERQVITGNSAGAMNGDGSRKALLHSTEGSSIEGAVGAYRTHNSWPHRTVDLKRRRVADHLDLGVAARSLRNAPGGADQTNRDGDVLIQYELVGSATNPASIGSKADLEWFGREVLGPDCRRMGVPLVSTVKWVAYPQSYGNAPQRLSPAAWDAYSGVLGHQHAPDNSHGDPGAIDIKTILAAARGEDDDMPLTTEDLNKIRTLVKAEIAAARHDYGATAAQLTHQNLNRALDPETGSGSVFRKALLEMAERGVGESLREGHPLDLRLDALVPPPTVVDPPAQAG